MLTNSNRSDINLINSRNNSDENIRSKVINQSNFNSCLT
jgi:hypothetical protein